MSGAAAYSYQVNVPGARGLIVRSSDGAFIPCDLGNMDYQRFLEYIAAGNPAPEGWTGPTNESSP